MSKYKDTSIWSIPAIKRGFTSGRAQTIEFRKLMESGKSIDDFMESVERDTSGQYGLVSPV